MAVVFLLFPLYILVHSHIVYIVLIICASRCRLRLRRRRRPRLRLGLRFGSLSRFALSHSHALFTTGLRSIAIRMGGKANGSSGSGDADVDHCCFCCCCCRRRCCCCSSCIYFWRKENEPTSLLLLCYNFLLLSHCLLLEFFERECAWKATWEIHS